MFSTSTGWYSGTAGGPDDLSCERASAWVGSKSPGVRRSARWSSWSTCWVT